MYNVEKYLTRCVNSICNQTYKNLEIILVDDGSLDRSGFICDELKKSDNRINVIHKKNGGLSSARNAGLDVAKGELITFVDSDDWIELDTYEYCVNHLRMENADVIQYEYATVSIPAKVVQPIEKLEVFYNKDIIQNYMFTTTTTGSYSVCRCVFCKEALKGIRFREGKINEDIDFKYKAFCRCRKYVYSNQIKYFYFQSGESLSTGGLKLRDFDLYDAADELYNLTKNEDYGSIAKLGAVKRARTAFSLLSKIAYYGVAEDALCENLIIHGLTVELRENLCILLCSPISISRKILALMFATNYSFTRAIIKMYKKWRQLIV